MNYTTTLETYEQLISEQVGVEQLPVSTELKLPTAPFPRKYVLSVFVDLQDARQAAYALHAAGFNERDIHILNSHEFVKSVTQDQSPFEIVQRFQDLVVGNILLGENREENGRQRESPHQH